MEPDLVYHASQVQGLKKVVPNKSTHGKKWVYATYDIVIAAAFLGDEGGDFTCSVGRDSKTSLPFICERFKGAFDLRYANIKGSIYELPAINFLPGKTQWEEEVVCSEPVRVFNEIRIENAKEYLLNLHAQGRLLIKYYPEKIDKIPEDDEDLVFRAVIWVRQYGEGILAQVKKYHPSLMKRIQAAIKNNQY